MNKSTDNDMNKQLTVIYSLSTKPYFAKNPKGEFSIDRFELYTAALSSLTRRCKGNKTVMHCDSYSAEYLHKNRLAGLWNEVKVTIPDDLDGINPRMFWAAGKLFALNQTECPVLMLDTDFIAWNQLLFSEEPTVVAAHYEKLSSCTYPSIEHFDMNEYTFDMRLDYTISPLNTAFLYMNNKEFKQYYVDCAMLFMKSAKDCDDYLTYMVYAEQRLLPMLAALKGIQVETVLDHNNLHMQENYTHIWGAKQIMRDNPHQYERFCEKCRNRIRNDFPEWEYILFNFVKTY